MITASKNIPAAALAGQVTSLSEIEKLAISSHVIMAIVITDPINNFTITNPLANQL